MHTTLKYFDLTDLLVLTTVCNFLLDSGSIFNDLVIDLDVYFSYGFPEEIFGLNNFPLGCEDGCLIQTRKPSI